jgi:hypothetical protein
MKSKSNRNKIIKKSKTSKKIGGGLTTFTRKIMSTPLTYANKFVSTSKQILSMPRQHLILLKMEILQKQNLRLLKKKF